MAEEQQTTSALVGSIKTTMADIDHRVRKIETQRSMIGRIGLASIWSELIPASHGRGHGYPLASIATVQALNPVSHPV